jgi:hypothetical protein
MRLKTPTHCPIVSPGIPERSSNARKIKIKNKKREWVEWPAQGCYAAISIQKNDIIH